MILNRKNLNTVTTREFREKEIKRLQAAREGDTLYAIGTAQNADIIETLLDMAKIRYYIGVKDYTSRYIKGTPTCCKNYQY